MNGLLIVLHGSPRLQANEPVLRIATRIRDSGRFGWVETAYLECNTPDIRQAVEMAVRAGAVWLTVVPVFLHPGRHVAVDIPSILNRCQQEFPELRLKLGWPVGRSSSITDALLTRAQDVP